MLNFELRTGPVVDPAPSYPDTSVAQWWSDAKIGMFFHWGIYSVPAWAELNDGSYVAPEDAYAKHQYAEWIGNTCRIPGSGARQFLDQEYSPGTTYEDLVDEWTAPQFDAGAWVDLAKRAGARYVIPTTKHHDGLCLWNTDTTPFNTVKRGPGLDVIEQLASAARAEGLKFGTYFSGALDWHVSDLPPIQSNRDLFTLRRNDEHFSQYAAAQLRELIERFRPDILWNDIEWPDGGKGNEGWSVASLWKDYFHAVPEGVVNDRWGVPAYGHLTREYSPVNEVVDYPWEATRGLGLSFGFNRRETTADIMDAQELISFVAHVVVRGGNALINVGPAADGSIPAGYVKSLEGLGAWTDVYGEGVYGTRPFVDWGQPNSRWATVAKDGKVYLYLFNNSESGGILSRSDEQLLPAQSAAYRWQSLKDPSVVMTGAELESVVLKEAVEVFVCQH